MSDDELIGWLEDEGALVMEGVDANGEIVLKVNSEKMKAIYPELYELMNQELSEVLLNLYEMGLVDVSYDDNLEARFSISEEGKKMMDKYGFGLEEDND